jgi:hypothetical protein
MCLMIRVDSMELVLQRGGIRVSLFVVFKGLSPKSATEIKMNCSTSASMAALMRLICPSSSTVLWRVCNTQPLVLRVC